MICRLCLKDIPKESSIKLYENLDTSDDSIEMVKLIEKYLEIEIKHNDIVSTIICQDCYDHLEEFHRFSQQVAEKQLTLRNEFLDVNLKKEFNFDDNDDAWDNDDHEDKIDPKETTQEMTINCPISMFKDETDDDEKDEQEMPTEDLMDTVICNNEKDIIAPDSVAVNDDDYIPDQISSDDDDVPLIKLKSTKKTSQKRKRKKAPAKPREIKEKKPAKKKLSAQDEVAMSIDLVCDICQTRVETWKALREHFLLAHTKTPYIKCCDIVYRKPRELIEHLEWHKNPDMFRCQICDKNMSSARNLTIHITSEHPDEADSVEFYECEHCSKRIRNYNLFKKHMRSHNKDQEVECHICNKRFCSEINLTRHICNMHKYTKYHVCDVCGQKYKNKESFKNHYAKHQGIIEPAAQCSICNRWLKNKHSLRLHRFVHEKHTTPCDICGKVFDTKHSLRKHKSYWHKSDLNLQCSFCEKVFRQERNLQEHMATHTGVQLYKCPHCQKESRSKSNMYVHIKRQHPTEWWQSKMERLNIDPKAENTELHQQY
ncbi:transcription factor grauzone-like isoform X2 [Calliphora vicina]|uniref:transcription factor grauzone-like isoform X2 n=1 Tax=Calliphora vicina TaxID=7373 RepID=UPI00325B5B26